MKLKIISVIIIASLISAVPALVQENDAEIIEELKSKYLK